VYGGDFKVTLSAASAAALEVLNIHGAPLTEAVLDASFNHIDVTHAIQTAPAHNHIRASIQDHLSISSAMEVDISEIELSLAQAIELVWYQSSSDVSLAHFVKGAVTTENFVSFYAFVEVGSGKVLNLVQLNDDEHLSDVTTAAMSSQVSHTVTFAAVPPSPFASPISDASIYCYDQYAKDFNDGEYLLSLA
jgi:hypothetical protein